MFLVHFGCDPEWLLNLDMLAFSSLSDSAMRLHFQQQAEDAYRGRMVAQDDAKVFTKYLKELHKGAGSTGGPDGDAMVTDLKSTGAIR